MIKKNGMLICSLGLMLFILIFASRCKIESKLITDIDGNIYDTIHYGSQVWLKQNLKVTHYSNGDSISNITNGYDWKIPKIAGYCDYDNSPKNSETYGKIYNWYVVNNGNLCPTGWHVPTDAEWATMIEYLGGKVFFLEVVGNEGEVTKDSLFTGATMPRSLNSIPGGFRQYDGLFSGIGEEGYWWTSTEIDGGNAWGRSISSQNDSMVLRLKLDKSNGFSVRCIRDN